MTDEALVLVVVAVWRCCPFCDTPLNDCVLLLLMLLDEEEVANVLLPLVVVDVLDVVVLLPVEAALADDFFHGWNPLPTAASAKGGGLLDDSLLHWAANMANGVPLNPGCSCSNIQNHINQLLLLIVLSTSFFLFSPLFSFKHRNYILHHQAVLKWGL